MSDTVLSNFNFILKHNDIFFINDKWEDENPGLFERIGTKFGTIDKSGNIILHTQAAQVLHKEISNRIIDLENINDLRKYLDGGIIKTQSKFNGQSIIKYKDMIIGTALASDNGIKSRFPRAKRTQEILVQ